MQLSYETMSDQSKFICDFDYSNRISWAEIELTAAINGLDIDFEFIRKFTIPSAMFDTAFHALLDGINKDSVFCELLKHQSAPHLIHYMVGAFAVDGYRFRSLFDYNEEYSRLRKYLHEQFRAVQQSGTVHKNRPYMFIGRLFKYNPVIVFKYYMVNRREIHRRFPEISSYISTKLVPSLSGNPKYNRLVAAFQEDFARENSYQKFIR